MTRAFSATSQVDMGASTGGWRVVLALFLCTLAMFGASIYAFIILAQPMSEQFAWSAAQTGSLVSAMWLVAPLALVSGMLTSRVRPWTVIAVGMALQALVLLAMAHVESFSNLYVLRVLMGLGKISVVSAVPIIVMRCFPTRFASALSIVWAGGAAGGLVMAPLAEELVRLFDWRIAATGLGAAVSVVTLVALVLGGRRGDAAMVPDANDHSARPRLSAFMDMPPVRSSVMFVAVAGAGMACIAVLTQAPAMLTAGGLAPAAAAGALGMNALGSLLGAAIIGWVLDRFAPVWASLSIALALSAGLVMWGLVPFAPSVVFAAVGAVLLGYAFGAGEVLWINLTKREFGEALFPLTYGLWYFALQFGYATGGGVAGLGFDWFGGSGFLIFVQCIYLPATLASIAFSLRRRSDLRAPGAVAIDLSIPSSR